jgi:hypothetical protein
MKARCSHGAPWFADCYRCRAEAFEVEQLRTWSRSYFPFWRTLEPAAVHLYLHENAALIIADLGIPPTIIRPEAEG